MPPRVVVVEARVYGNNTFSAVVACWAEGSSFFRPPRRTRKARGTPLEPPHPVVRAASPNGTVDTAALRLARLEGARIAERKVRVPTFGTVRARRAGLHVVVYGDVVAPRQVVVVVLEETTGRTCLLYTSPSPRDGLLSRMPSSA